VDYFGFRQSFAYSFSRRTSENAISEVSSERNAHLFRWSAQAIPLGSRLNLTSNYTFSRRSETVGRTGEGEILNVIPGAGPLYAEDPSPDLGELVPFTPLGDGDRESPADSSINMGGTSSDHNLGFDLGIEGSVGGIYVYVDRASGPALTWTVWTSRDNLVWEIRTRSPAVEFNVSLNRYEILFENTSARYIKVVKSGTNPESEVLVTEIEALREATPREGNTHLVDAGLSYRSRKLAGSVDASFQKRPFLGTTGVGRDRADYSVGVRYRQFRAVSHSARWQQGFETFDSEGGDEKATNWAYSLLLTPMETLDITTSLTGNFDHLDGTKIGDSRAALILIAGNPITGLNLSAQATRSRTEEFIADRILDVWNYRVNVDGAVTRSLETAFTYSYQKVDISTDSAPRIRNRYSVDLNYRLTNTVFARSSVDFLNEEQHTLSHDYLLSWNLSRKLTLGAQAFFTESEGEFTTRRYNVNLDYEVNSRSDLLFSYTKSDFTEAGGTETTSIQTGIRAGF
jgi:hypothetical protein